MDIKLPDEESYLQMLKEMKQPNSKSTLNEFIRTDRGGERGGFGTIKGKSTTGGFGTIGGRPIKREEEDDELAKTSEMEPDTDDLQAPGEKSYDDDDNMYSESFELFYEDEFGEMGCPKSMKEFVQTWKDARAADQASKQQYKDLRKQGMGRWKAARVSSQQSKLALMQKQAERKRQKLAQQQQALKQKQQRWQQ